MSYYCQISFKSIKPENIDKFFVQFKQRITENLQEIAKDEYPYCPFIREKLYVPDNYKDIDHKDKRLAEYWARSSVFQYKYMYDDERNLLCVFGTHGCTHDLFDGVVFFQNSTDHDYSCDAYQGISSFEGIFEKWNNKTDAEILKDYYEHRGESLYDDYDVQNASSSDKEAILRKRIDYYKRDAVYDEIWGNYENTLWDDSKAVYLSLYGPYEIIEVQKFIIACYNEKREQQRLDEIYEQELKEGKHPEMQAWIDRYMERHPELKEDNQNEEPDNAEPDITD